MRKTLDAAGFGDCRGFTAIELMVVVLIIAVLLALALPSFESTSKRYRVSTAASEIANALQLARMNAVRTRHNTLVNLTNQSGCNAADWICGIDIWEDVNSNGQQNTGQLLKTLSETDFKMLDVRFVGTANTNMAYSPLGFLGGVNSAGTFSSVQGNEMIYVWQLTDGGDPSAQSVYANTICLAPGGKINIVPRYDAACT